MSAKRQPKLSQFHIDRMVHLRTYLGLDLVSIGRLYGHRSSAEVQAILNAAASPVQPASRVRKTPIRAKRVADELVAEMHALYAGGLPLDEVARRFDRTHATLRDLFRTRGLACPINDGRKRRGGKRVPDERVAEMYAAYSAGESLAEVARRFERSPVAIREVFRSRGFALRNPPPNLNTRRGDGSFQPFVPKTPAEIEAIVASMTRLWMPPEIRNDWRHWSLAQRGDFLDRVRAKLAGARWRPTTPFSSNVEPFDYATQKAHDIIKALHSAKSSPSIKAQLRLASQGVIYRGELWFWNHQVGYVTGAWTPKCNRLLLHRAIWEEHHGRKLSSNELIRFADGNRNNFDPSNLTRIDRVDAHAEGQAKRWQKQSREKLTALLNRHQKTGNHELVGQLLQHA